MIVALVAAVSGASGTRTAVPKVTVIGDSVLTGVLWYSQATAILEQNLDVRFQVAVCRRLTGVGCTFQGVTPPNLLQVTSSLGHDLGPTVVVVMGYNDYEDTFARSVEASVQALLHQGVTRIIWATLREARHPYVHMNNIVRAAAKQHPELTVVDWNEYSRSHPDWFQNDGIHLQGDGGTALATFLHTAIMTAFSRPLALGLAPQPLPVARVARPYVVRLYASNGVRPYRFQLVGGALPRGLKLQPDGLIVGTPARVGRALLELRESDARGRSTVRYETLVVAR